MWWRLVQEENFGYSLAVPGSTIEDAIPILRDEIKSSKRYTAFHVFQAAVIPYFAERCYGKFAEPLDSIVYSGMILLEILAVGACLHSAYDWYSASKCVKELETLAAEK